MARATGARVASPAPPVPRSSDVASPGRALKPAGPAARDPRFLRVVAQVQRNAVALKKHPPAARKAAEAQAAAVPPSNERTAGAMADQVDAMTDAKTESPKTDGFLALLRAEIEKVMPKTLDDTQHFMEGGAKDQVKGAVGTNVRQSKDAATGPVEVAAAAPPDPSGTPDRTPTPAPADAPTSAPALDAQGAVPPAQNPAEVAQQKYADAADARLKDAELTDTQLQKANDPRFTAVLGAKQDVKARAAASPGQYRGAENRLAAAGIARAAADGRAQFAGMAVQRGHAGAQVQSRQQLAKERDEQRRKTVTDKIESIYQRTKASVELRLSTLEADVMAAFDVGMNSALADLKAWTDLEIQKFKDQRYEGITGKGRWLADLFRPVPPEIKQILVQGKARFTAAMDAVAVKVAGLVDTRLAAAKAEIQKGQAEVAGYVAGLPADLRSVGKAAEGELQARFKELEDGVDAKKQALAESLANKYKEASDKADAELKKIEAANEGALKGLADKVGAVFKIISEFKDKLMGILRKGQETIKLILADPIGFLGNLIAAVKGGLNAFVGNLKSWLLKGLASWLFGSLAGAGITMPADLSLGSIFKLVMELLGISYAKIRAKAVKLVGEPVVKTVETLAEFVSVFLKGGPAALWAHLKEKLSELKSMVLDAIIAWVTETIVTQAVTKIVSMCNPAGAIVQACIAIYNVVMFVVERASQIMAFVEAIINSVHSIATGSIGGAITWIEQALGRTVPLVISFFARLIGLGGITAKIVSIIKTVQAKVDKALDWLIEKIVGGLKKLVKSPGSGKDKDWPERTEAEKRRDLDSGLSAAEAVVKREANPEKARAALPGIKTKYRMTSLELISEGVQGEEMTLRIQGVINPSGQKKAKKTVSDENHPDAIAAKADTAKPTPTTAWDDKKFCESDRGNKRLFALLKSGKRFVFIVRSKRWNPIKDDAAIKAAEDALRTLLAGSIPGYKEMVDASKPVNAPGFDAVGVVGTGPTAQLHIGEVKGSAPTASKQYMPKEKFTALTINLAQNLLETLPQVGVPPTPEQSSVEAALQAGNVTVHIHLSGGMQIGQRAAGRKRSTKQKIETAIRKSFKAFLAAEYPGIKLEDVAKNIQIIWTP